MSYKYFGRLVGKVSTGKQALTESAPANTLTPFDPQAPATKFMAYGEDATSLAFNRALAALATNIESLTSVLNTVSLRSAVIPPVRVVADEEAATAGWGGETSWLKGSVALSDNYTISDDAGHMNSGLAAASQLIRAYKTDLHLAGGVAAGRVPAQWVYVGLTEAELSRHVTFQRVEGQHGSMNTLAVGSDGDTNFSTIADPVKAKGRQTIQETSHEVSPTNVYENSSEYNGGSGFTYHQPKYKNQKQAYLTAAESSGIPLYVPPIKRIRTDLPPYTGNERYARISSWDTDGLYIKDYSADDLYLKPGCFVEITGDGAEGAQAGNNGLFQIAQIVPADATPPTGIGTKLILTRGGFHKVTVRDYMQFMEGEFVSWRTAPYHEDSGDPTDGDSTALNPAARSNYAHIAFIVPRPDLLSDSRPDDRPGDLYLSAATDHSRFTTKNYDGTDGDYDWTRGVPFETGGTFTRYSGQRSRNSVGLPDKETDAKQNWGLLPGTFLFHGHAHMWPEEYAAGEWNMGAIGTVKFGSDILGSAEGVHDSVVAAGEPVVFSLETAPGLMYGCAPQGFILNPVLKFDEGRTFINGSYQAYIKTLSTVREDLVSALKPDYLDEGLNLENPLSFGDAQKLLGWQNFIRTGTNAVVDGMAEPAFNFGVGDDLFHPRNDGLNTPFSQTAQILGGGLWELKVAQAGGPGNTLSSDFAHDNWGPYGDFVAFIHPDSHAAGSTSVRRYYGKIVSAQEDPDDPTVGKIIVSSLYAPPGEDQPEHDHLNVLAGGGWPIQAFNQNSSYGSFAGPSTFETTRGDLYGVTDIIKAPLVMSGLDTAFIPSHGLNAAYHNHFSANEELRWDGSTNPLDATIPVQSGTGHTIYANPTKPLTVVSPAWQDFEQAIRVRSSSDNITLVRLDGVASSHDDVYTKSPESESLVKARIGYAEVEPTLPINPLSTSNGLFALRGALIEDLTNINYSLLDSSGGHGYTEFGASSQTTSLTFGSADMHIYPDWFNSAVDDEYDYLGRIVVEGRGSQHSFTRKDIALTSGASAPARDEFLGTTPSNRSAAYDLRSTPAEAQDRSIMGALEASILGNYNHDIVNKAVSTLWGTANTQEIGGAFMSTGHQFGVFSNGVITGGYCFAKCNEDSGDTFAPDILEEWGGSGVQTFAELAASIGSVAASQRLFLHEAYVVVGGAKWHIPSQMFDITTWVDYAGGGISLGNLEFMVWFDARARRVLIRPIIQSESELGNDQDWSGNYFTWSKFDEAHVVPLAKVVMEGGPGPDFGIQQVINLRKPITRVDQKTHILVGTANRKELEYIMSHSAGAGLQTALDEYTQTQLHFKSVTEALSYIEHISKANAYEGRKWTIEVVGSTYEADDLSRGLSLPAKFPTHGITIIGHRGMENTYLHNRTSHVEVTGNVEDSSNGTYSSFWVKPTESTSVNKPASWEGQIGVIPGSGPVIRWDSYGPLFDLNSRHGVTVKDINLQYTGYNEPPLLGVGDLLGKWLGNYWDNAWDVGTHVPPHIAAFICSRPYEDSTLPGLDADRGSQWQAVYGTSHSNAAYSGNYTFEGVTLHNGGILIDFYAPTASSDHRTLASLDNISLKNCRAINVTHGLAAFGCPVDESDLDNDSNGLASLLHTATLAAGSTAKYHKGIFIENCEAVCVPSENGGDAHTLWEDEDTVLNKRRAGIFATQTKELTVRNCSFHGQFAYGVYLGEDVAHAHFFAPAHHTQHWTTGTIENNTIFSPLEVGIYAYSEHDFSDVRINNNTIRDPGVGYYKWRPEIAAAANAVHRCEDPWGIVVNGANYQVTGNTIRHSAYALNSWGSITDFDLSKGKMTGGIHVTPRISNEYADSVYEDKTSIISDNTLHLVGKALKGIVIAHQTEFGWVTKSTHSHGLRIQGNTIVNDITEGYAWNTGYYDYDNPADATNLIDDVAADFEADGGYEYPYGIFVGEKHRAVKIVNNNITGPIYLGAECHNSIIANNTVKDPAAELNGELAVASFDAGAPISNTNGKSNTAVLMSVGCANLTITNNQLHNGHIFLDQCATASISGNNLYPHSDYHYAFPCNQPVGIFLRQDCNQANVVNNMIPGNGYVFVGAGGSCYDCSIRGNKWGVRLETLDGTPMGGSGFYAPFDPDREQSYMADPALGDFDFEGDDIANGGLVYWRGGGGLITDNVLMNNDIFVGNKDLVGSVWEGIYNPLSASWAGGIAERKAGQNFVVRGNKLNGGSIHLYAPGSTVESNDLTRYLAEHGGTTALEQQITATFFFYGISYAPNIEAYAPGNIVRNNRVPATIYVYDNDNGVIEGNRVGGDIVAVDSDGISVLNNNLSMVHPQFPDIDFMTGEVDWTGFRKAHQVGLGNIYVLDSKHPVIDGNQSVCGLEDGRELDSLLGVRTDPDDHLYYADLMSPFRTMVQDPGSLYDFTQGITIDGDIPNEVWWAVAAYIANGGTVSEEAMHDAIYDSSDFLSGGFKGYVGHAQGGTVYKCAQYVDSDVGKPGHPGLSATTNWAAHRRESLNNYGAHDGGKVGPYAPLNYHCVSGGDRIGHYMPDSWEGTEKLITYAETYQEWGRRVYIHDCPNAIVSNNKMSHIEMDNCAYSKIDGNTLYWGGFNPGYPSKNHSILVSGNQVKTDITHNRCHGSIWVQDSFSWTGEYYTWGGLQEHLNISYNTCGNNAQNQMWATMSFFSNEKAYHEDVDDGWSWYSKSFLAGGGGHILADNCTGFTCIGNRLNHHLGAFPDRWFDQPMDGMEFGQIWINRLGNPFKPSWGGEGKLPQNFGTVITNNMAAGAMGWVRQPDKSHQTAWLYGNDVGGTHYEGALENASGGSWKGRFNENRVSDFGVIEDRVVPCIGFSAAPYSGNRLEHSLLSVLLDAWTPGGAGGIEVHDLEQNQWRYKAAVGAASWWGNMDSTLGPYQANGNHEQSAVPTCTNQRWFGHTGNYRSTQGPE